VSRSCLAAALVAVAPPAFSASPAAPDEVALAYYGDFITHPGASGRVDWPLNGDDPFAVLVEVEVGGYWHPNLMVALFARTGPELRWTGPKGGLYGAFAHVGVEHGFWAAPTYRVEGGEVRTVALAGDSWGVFAAGLDFGHTLPGEVARGWFARPQFGMRFPTFHTVGFDLAVEVGVKLR